MCLCDTKTVKDLKALLRQRGLDTRGQKYVLIERLEEFDNCVDEEVAQEVTRTNHSSVVIDEDVSVNVNDASKTSSESETIRVLQLQHQIEELKLQQAQLAHCRRSDAEVVGKNLDFGMVKAKLPTMGLQTDIITFLASWERCLQLNNVPCDRGANLLPTCLNERASAVYATQSIADCQDYEVTRAFLCEAFKANPSVYRKRLLGLRRQGTDSYKMFLSKLTDLQDHYLQSKSISSFEMLKQDNLFHLFMDSL
jgi:hypothetical protein